MFCTMTPVAMAYLCKGLAEGCIVQTHCFQSSKGLVRDPLLCRGTHHEHAHAPRLCSPRLCSRLSKPRPSDRRQQVCLHWQQRDRVVPCGRTAHDSFRARPAACALASSEEEERPSPGRFRGRGRASPTAPPAAPREARRNLLRWAAGGAASGRRASGGRGTSAVGLIRSSRGPPQAAAVAGSLARRRAGGALAAAEGASM